MKTSCLTLLLAFTLAFACHAQTQKGTLMIGGGGSAEFEDGFSASLNPNLGYFVANNVAVGSGLSLCYGKSSSLRSVGAGVQPFVRYYFGQQAPTRFFAVASGSVLSHRTEVENGIVEYEKSTSHSFGGGLGVVHFLTDQVGLEAQLLYRNSRTYYNIYYDDIPPSWNGGLGLSLGVQIHLPRKAYK